VSRAPVTSTDHSTSQTSSGRVSLSSEANAAPAPARRRLPSISFTALTAILALVSGGVALAFQLVPSLKPDPGEQFAADLRFITVEPKVTLGDWLRRTSRTTDQFAARRAAYLRQGGSAGGLRIAGFDAYVVTEIRGFKRKNVDLRWSLYDAKRQVRIGEMEHVAGVHAEAPTDRTVQEIWIADPLSGRQFFVRAQLYDSRGVLLAVADSKPFPVRT